MIDGMIVALTKLRQHSKQHCTPIFLYISIIHFHGEHIAMQQFNVGNWNHNQSKLWTGVERLWLQTVQIDSNSRFSPFSHGVKTDEMFSHFDNSEMTIN